MKEERTLHEESNDEIQRRIRQGYSGKVYCKKSIYEVRAWNNTPEAKLEDSNHELKGCGTLPL